MLSLFAIYRRYHLTSDNDEGEDKMSKGAEKEGLSPKEIADKYIAIFER